MEISAPPYLPINKKGAHVFVLSCIDPRFTEYLAHFLINDKQVHSDYDLFALAGASLGANEKKTWRDTLFEHIDIAIQLHKIKAIWVFEHMDCGMYKETLGIKQDNNPHTHMVELHKLKMLLKTKYPRLEYKGYIMNTDGGIYQISY